MPPKMIPTASLAIAERRVEEIRFEVLAAEVEERRVLAIRRPTFAVEIIAQARIARGATARLNSARESLATAEEILRAASLGAERAAEVRVRSRAVERAVEYASRGADIGAIIGGATGAAITAVALVGSTATVGAAIGAAYGGTLGGVGAVFGVVGGGSAGALVGMQATASVAPIVGGVGLIVGAAIGGAGGAVVGSVVGVAEVVIERSQANRALISSQEAVQDARNDLAVLTLEGRPGEAAEGAAGLGRASSHLPSGGFWHGMWTDDGVNTMTLIALANTGALVARAVRVEQGNIKGLSMAISAAKESGSSRCVIPILYSAGEGPLHWLGIVLNSSESTMTATYIDPEGLDPVPEVALALRNAGVNDVSVANMPTQTCSDNCGEVLIFGFANSLGANIGSVANAASILSDMLASHLSSSPNEGSAAGTNLPQVVEVGPSETVLRLDPVKGMSRAFTNAVRQGRETASELLIKIEELLYVVLDAPQGAREVLFTNMLLGMADDLNNKEALTPFFTGGGPNGDPDNGGGSSGGGEKENGADNSFSALLGMNSSNKSSLVGITDDTDSITS